MLVLDFLRLLTGYTFLVAFFCFVFYFIESFIFYTLFQELLDVNTYIKA